MIRQLLDGGTPPDLSWQDLDEYWLKDVIRPMHIYQVRVPDLPQEFPPLKSLDAPLSLAGSAGDEGAPVENP